MYEVSSKAVWELFAPYLTGNPQGIALVASAAPLSDDARNACEKSLAARGYGQDACTYLALSGAHDAEGLVAVDAEALRTLVEGIDPLVLVCADSRTAALTGTAYGVEVAPDSFQHILGRPTVAFTRLEEMLDTDAHKHAAWALFKTIPLFATVNRRKA